MRKTTAGMLTALIAAFMLCTILAQISLPGLVRSVENVFPEVQPIVIPAIIGGVVAIMCWQGIALIGLKLVSLSHQSRLNRSSRIWIQIMAGLLAFFIILTIGAFVALNIMSFANPGALLILVSTGFAAVIMLVITFINLESYRFSKIQTN